MLDPKEIIIIVAGVISTGIAVYKVLKNGTMLKAVVKGVEESAQHVNSADMTRVKNQIQDKARQYNLGNALHKVVKKITSRG